MSSVAANAELLHVQRWTPITACSLMQAHQDPSLSDVHIIEFAAII